MLCILIFIALRFDINTAKHPDAQPVFLLASSQNPKTTTDNPSLQERNTTNETRESESQAANKGKITVPTCVSEPSPKADTKKDDPYDAGRDSLYRWYLRFTICGVLVALGGILAIYFQGKVIKNAERAWITAKPKNWSQEIYFVREGHSGPLKANVFVVAFFNAGKTPARLLETSMRYLVLDSLSDLPSEPEYKTRSSHEGIILAPNDDFFGAFATLEPQSILLEHDFFQLVTHEKLLYAYGFISYRDVYGKKRLTRFGYRYHFNPSGDVSPAGFQYAGPPSYNQAT